jgi:hypothetical protein
MPWQEIQNCIRLLSDVVRKQDTLQAVVTQALQASTLVLALPFLRLFSSELLLQAPNAGPLQLSSFLSAVFPETELPPRYFAQDNLDRLSRELTVTSGLLFQDMCAMLCRLVPFVNDLRTTLLDRLKWQVLDAQSQLAIWNGVGSLLSEGVEISADLLDTQFRSVSIKLTPMQSLTFNVLRCQSTFVALKINLVDDRFGRAAHYLLVAETHAVRGLSTAETCRDCSAEVGLLPTRTFTSSPRTLVPARTLARQSFP